MPFLPHLRSFCRNLLHSGRADAELDQEVRSYVDLLAEEKMQAGLAPQEALRAARIEAGGIEQVTQEVRDTRSGAWLASLLQDLRYAGRTLRKRPGFTITVVLTLALGIGVNTGIFSIVEFMFRSLPVVHPEQLVVLATGQNHQPETEGFSYPEYLDLKHQASTFSDMAGYQVDIEALSAQGQATQFFMTWVTGNYFTMLGVKPYLGRLFLPNEGQAPGADPYLVLGYDCWKNRFHSDPNVIGSKATVAGHALTIIGVTPKTFHGTYYAFDSQGYVLFSIEAAETATGSLWGNGGFWRKRDNRLMTIMGRLGQGVDLEQAQASVNVIARRFAQQYPESSRDLSVRVYPEKSARPQPDPSSQMPLVAGLFLVLAGLVMLLACMNVANIVLVQVTVRQREMAVRAALGARRGRLMRQLITETMLLAVLGGAAGLLLGMWGSDLIAGLPSRTMSLPFQLDFGFNVSVFCYTFAVAVLAGLVVGVLPARRAARADLNTVLHESGRSVISGRNRLRNSLVVAEVGGSLILLVIAGLFLRSLHNALHMDLGFDPNHVVTLTVDPHEMGYSEAQGRKFFRELLDGARTLPGVESAALSYSIPMGYYNSFTTLDQVEGHSWSATEERPTISYNLVGPEYFSTLRIPLVHGRVFTRGDDQNAPRVAVINRAMAAHFWPNQEAIGKRFKTKARSEQGQWFEVVGVVGDGKYLSPTDQARPYIYLSLAQNYTAIECLQVRTALAPDVILAELRRQARTLAPDLPVFDAQPMNRSLETFNGFFLYRLGAEVAAAMGLLGLAMAVIGIYGVVSYAASQRTHEIGIRMALGAGRADVLKMVLRSGLLLVGLGVAFGLAVVFAAAHLFADFLIGISATDPLTFAAVSLLLTLVALAACYIPAHRAMRVDPMVALRYE